MKQIYLNSLSVIIWLRRATQNNVLALDFVLQNGRMSLKPKASEQGKTLVTLCHRNYLQSIWIFQELSPQENWLSRVARRALHGARLKRFTNTWNPLNLKTRLHNTYSQACCWIALQVWRSRRRTGSIQLPQHHASELFSRNFRTDKVHTVETRSLVCLASCHHRWESRPVTLSLGRRSSKKFSG